MSKTSEFVAELMRAANNLEKRTQTADGKRNHPYPASSGPGGCHHEAKRLRPFFEPQFISAAITIGWATDTLVKMALVEAAGAIGDLGVVLDHRARSGLKREDPDDPSPV